MAIPAEQVRECLSAVAAFLIKRRPPPEMRHMIDYSVDINRSDVLMKSVRPAYNDETKKAEFPFAKATWIDRRKVWRLFWMRGDLKWHSYQPLPESPSIAALLGEVDRDPHCCFFG